MIFIFLERAHEPDPWSEVYNVDTGKVSTTTSPPHRAGIWKAWVVSDSNGNEKPLGSSECLLYEYDSIGDTWNLFDDNFGLWIGPNAYMDGIIYFLRGKDIHGYNIGTKKWYPNPMSGLEDVIDMPRGYNIYLPHVYPVAIGNGNLCLIWRDKKDNSLNFIRCRSCVRLETKQPSLYACDIHRQSFTTDVYKILNCFPIAQVEEEGMKKKSKTH